ncbi:sodium/solute symporter [Alteromonas pelagimontana]|uniref:Sodium/solute symporter n=1 Tax=Alteromonas pelagimontana TaxID=1858656 RepID=A0A6M4MDU6_9ALTE|nr:sodium/solute symporter [Alteromonas pelagimontana]QJR80316.1 sodium/solute symporter [Alteromonas pelagimontana]
MTWLDYTIIGIYLAGLLLLGVVFRQQKSGNDYFLGGRSLSWPTLTLSVMATQLSAISFISAPAFVGLREGGGLIWLSYELALPIAVAIMLWRLLPTLHNAGVVSVYDYLEKRFSRSTRLLISFVFQLSRSFATAIMIYAISLILQGTMGLTQWHSIMIIGVITLIYSAMGGMKAVVYGDAIQMILILAGAALCLWAGLDAIGGWTEVMANVDPQRLVAANTESAGWSGSDFGLLPMIFGGIILYASYYGCDQSEAQRSLSSRNLGDLRKMLLAVAFLRFPITLLYCTTGLVIGTLVLQQPELQAQIPANEPDWMMPVFIIEYLPTGLIGILVVAIMAAAMSSLSSAINSLAAVTVEDLCRLRNAKPDNATYMKYARIAGVGWGLLTLLLSLYAGDIAPTVIEAINKIGSVFYGPVLAVFLLGIQFRSVSAKAANTGLTLGVLVNVTLWLSGSPLFWFWWNLIGFVITMVVALVISRFIPNDVRHILPSVRGISVGTVAMLVVWSGVLVFICLQIPDWLLALNVG